MFPGTKVFLYNLSDSSPLVVAMGGESTNLVVNMSQYLMVAAFALAATGILLGVALLIYRFRKPIMAKLNDFYSKFVFNGIIRSITLCYVKLCISTTILNYSQPLTESQLT